MASAINTAFMRLSRRAETSAREQLIQTFVDVGPLFTLLSSHDHQILYGRRGTGKTHALNYLADRREQLGDAVAFVDLRNIGSSGGIYADPSRAVQERGTCLLVDTLAAIHEALLTHALNHHDECDLSQVGPALDALAQAITEVRIVGSVETEESASDSAETRQTSSAGLRITGSALSIESGEENSASGAHQQSQRVRRAGKEEVYVNFGSAGAAFRQLATAMGGQRIWILLDEWSSVPAELQPYLADLLRRSLFPSPGVTVKIAAIEQRSRFQLVRPSREYIGIEVGADASADVNLDDFMVFDNDANRASAFFEDLVFRHVRAVAVTNSDVPTSADELIRRAFTQIRSFEEFVRASEGVPRDAINILALAAQKALDDSISKEHIRIAAKNWYQRDKDTAVRANPDSHDLLHWIIDQVIGERRARAFLLLSNTSDPLIESLYDARVLHVLKRGISTHDNPGVRYDVYKLDYGCYVDLITTAKAPLGLLPLDFSDGNGEFVEVPPDDYRSIRRAILDLERFQSRKKPRDGSRAEKSSHR